ncbi:glycosyltransferase family 4 protein [Rhizobium sp. C1]|uniref:glycosyltransferase family 4 protein n=1 Tax=Rhizobium sp. C1 TaxID=1349799 RepID=UPI001E407F97|nr:glycosyltransferase family 4 protein [Rhizobium sp. C1]MCD2178049.1 glycosyltransferase family 4 protein [Rhizobium sp. C1]
MTKILHLIHTPRHSGAEILVRDLCLIHSRQGIECAVASFGPMAQEFGADSQRLQETGTKQYFPNVLLKKIKRINHFRKVFEDFQPDAVFGHSVLPSIYGRLALPLAGRKPKFVTVLHSASNDDFEGAYMTSLEFALRWRSDQVVAVSKLGAQNYRRRFGDSVPVEIVPNGIDVVRFRAVDRMAARAAFGIAPETRIILQVGRLSVVKQQDLSIRALADYLKMNNAELWLAGLTEEPQYETKLRQMVAENGLSTKVKFLGSRADVPELLAAADLYLMPSLAEAHSIAVIEALASGIPVVLSDIPAFADFKSMEGVYQVDGRSEVSLREIAEQFPVARYLRPLARYELAETAGCYLNLSSKAVHA